VKLEVKIEIDNPPVPHQSGVRFSRGRVFKSAKLRDFEEEIGYHSLKHSKCGIPMGAAIKMGLEFSYPHNRFADLDNVTKSVLDGMEGVLFDNDKQIFDLQVKRSFNSDKKYTISVKLEYKPEMKRFGVEK